jgi:hypothetical protein
MTRFVLPDFAKNCVSITEQHPRRVIGTYESTMPLLITAHSLSDQQSRSFKLGELFPPFSLENICNYLILLLLIGLHETAFAYWPHLGKAEYQGL